MLKYAGQGRMRPVDFAINAGNRVIKRVIALVILAIFTTVTDKLPGADRVLTGWFHVDNLVTVVVLFIMLGIVLSARFPLEGVAVYFIHRRLRDTHFPEGSEILRISGASEYLEVSPSMHRLASETVNMIVILILWPIMAQIVNVLLLIDVKGVFEWTFIVVMVVFPSLLFYRLYLAYSCWRSKLDVKSDEESEIPCPRCGTLNMRSARFCVKCGCPLLKDY